DTGIWQIALVLCGATFLMAIGTFGKQYLMSWAMNRATIDVQRDLANSLLRQSVTFFNVTRKGELLSRITHDLNGVRQTFHIIFNDLIQHPIAILSIIAVMVYKSPQLCLILLVFPVVLTPVTYFAGKIRRLSRRSIESHVELTNFFHQFFEGVRVVKAFGMEGQQRDELGRVSSTHFTRSIKVGKYMALSRAIVEFVLGLLVASLITLGAWTLSEGMLGEETSFATLMMFVGALILAYDPIRKLSDTLNKMSNSMASNERVFELMQREPEMKDAPDAPNAPRFSHEIVFNNVGFEYLPGRPVLQDISFRTSKGSMTALVGATGAGKSTLMDLIPRFYAPTKGAITVDGVDLANVRLASWLEQIAVVSQETFLFNTSIRENLLAANQNASESDLIEALKAANIYDEVAAMPQGIDTVLGDRGVNLSGGQRQRIAIARAFVKRAPILLLDEATSALDTETERKVQAALDRLIKGATVFAIAHRLSTITHAQQILVLDQGRIIESGTHDQLLARNGRYAMLYETQIRSFSGGAFNGETVSSAEGKA
ncbi:MAG: ABC transporter ATP-binding protein, partial [Planctomycetaceae bacterium]|nr:ABC transporter ATP-binding protein [Planctomycetaceae bacterium]